MRTHRSLASRCLPVVGSVAAALATFSGCKCGTQKDVVNAVQVGTFVPGSPTVQPENPSVQIGAQPPPVIYGDNVPKQCDSFTQSEIRQIDILWMVDSSGSMAARQMELQANFQAFITYLLSSKPPIDFHIAVITADADDPKESGTLHTWSEGLPNGQTLTGNFIACDANQICNVVAAPDGVCAVAGNQCSSSQNCCSGSQCNQNGVCDPTSNVVDAFTQISNVGTNGSPVERGLYTSYLAMVNPENQDPTPAGTPGFIRPNAGLYVVMVSDEDDSSCTPQIGQPSGSTDFCVNDPGCRCDDNPTFGTTSYWAQFFKTYKGFDKGNFVTVGAIVGANIGYVTSQFGDQPYFPGTTENDHVGCVNPLQTKYAVYWGKRYSEVVALTGGSLLSICDESYASALNQLGFAVTGLRTTFHLSRGPELGSITAVEAPATTDCAYLACQSDADCMNNVNTGCQTAFDGNGNQLYTSCQSGRCTQSIPLTTQSSSTSAQYQECINQVVLNSVSFGAQVIPPAQGSVEICYAVDPNFSDNECQ